jgi:hypothetical protein
MPTLGKPLATYFASEPNQPRVGDNLSWSAKRCYELRKPSDSKKEAVTTPTGRDCGASGQVSAKERISYEAIDNQLSALLSVSDLLAVPPSGAPLVPDAMRSIVHHDLNEFATQCRSAITQTALKDPMQFTSADPRWLRKVAQVCLCVAGVAPFAVQSRAGFRFATRKHGDKKSEPSK